MNFLFLFLLSLYFLCGSNGERILVLTPIGSRSHKIFYMGIVEALAARGHEVTVVSAYPEFTKKKNIRDVLIQTLDIDSIVSSTFENSGNAIKNLIFNAPYMCSDTLGEKDVQNLKREKFDIVLLSVFFNYCYLSLVEHFKVPFVYICSGGLFTPFTEMANNVDFPSIVPSKILDVSSPMSFVDRLLNTCLNMFFSSIVKFYIIPRTEKICKERGLCPEEISLFDMANNSSLTIVNSFRMLEQPPRPVIPNIVFAGGAHLKPAKPLPRDLELWISGAGKDGFIFFSLGSALNPSVLPERYRKILVNVFGSLKQKVLWKWNEETMADLPKNVMLRKWLPQRDILGHPSIKLFITHGGLLSTQESTYNGVPVIGMPVYGDQHSNMKEAENEGWGRVMNWKDLEENAFRKLILDTIHNHNLQVVIKQRAAIMRDRPIEPDQEAAFWVEYVLRHKGAPHIMSPFKNLTWFYIYNVDVWTLIVCFILLIIWILWKILHLLFTLIFGSEKPKKKKKKKSKRPRQDPMKPT